MGLQPSPTNTPPMGRSDTVTGLGVPGGCGDVGIWRWGLPGACSPHPFGVSVSPSLWGFSIPIPLGFLRPHPFGVLVSPSPGGHGDGGSPHFGVRRAKGTRGCAMPPTGVGAVPHYQRPNVPQMAPGAHVLCSGVGYGGSCRQWGPDPRAV